MMLPDNLPIPKAEGMFNHLINTRLPQINLPSTSGENINLLDFKLAIIFCYPKTGNPDVQLPDGWKDIPGAFGCTSQACSFSNIKLEKLEQYFGFKINVFGLSTQTTDDQIESSNRLNLDYPLLSYRDYIKSNPLQLPLLTHHGEIVRVEDQALLKRGTIIVVNRIIRHIIDPDFPPNRSAERAVNWMNSNSHKINVWLTK